MVYEDLEIHTNEAVYALALEYFKIVRIGFLAYWERDTFIPNDLDMQRTHRV